MDQISDDMQHFYNPVPNINWNSSILIFNMQTTISLFDLPGDILFPCVGEFLDKREQYSLVSLCKRFTSRMYQCRLVHIKECSMVDRKKSGVVWRIKGHCFKSFQDALGKAFVLLHDTVVGRQFRLSLDYRTLIDCILPLLRQYLVHFDQINVNFPADFDQKFDPRFDTACAMRPETICLASPTLDMFDRFLRTGYSLPPFHGFFDLASMCEVAQYVSRKLPTATSADVPGSESVSISSLRGVHRLVLIDDKKLFVVVSPDSDSILQCLELRRCFRIHDVTSFACVPQVKLVNCKNILDVSPLSSVTSLELSGLYDAENYVDLGNVQELTLKDCRINNFPVPSAGRGQEWQLYSLSGDLSAFANLEKLTLIECFERDVSMIARVKSLEFCHCNLVEKFPTATSNDQQLTFRNMNMVAVSLKQFTGFHTLNLHNCEVFLSDIYGITNLTLVRCILRGNLISNVFLNTLILQPGCTQIRFAENVKITHLIIQVDPSDEFLVLEFCDFSRGHLQTICVSDMYGNTLVELQKAQFDVRTWDLLEVRATLTGIKLCRGSRSNVWQNEDMSNKWWEKDDKKNVLEDVFYVDQCESGECFFFLDETEDEEVNY